MSSKSRVLITGGAGFIGSWVSKQFIEEDGAEVLVVDNLSFGDRSLVDDRAEFVDVDITSDRLDDVVQDYNPNIVVHLAALHFIPYCNENPEEAFNVNVIGTRNLTESLSKLESLESFVFASSAAVYPPRNGPNSEDSDLGPTDIYGRSKLVGEDLCRLFYESTEVPTAVLRLFNVFGPNETNEHLIPAILEQLDDESPTIELGNLKPARDFVHVRDVARAFYDVSTAHEAGFESYNVGTGTEYTVEEVAEAIIEASSYDVSVQQAPDRVRESDRPHLQADISKIQSEIDWSPSITFSEGVAELVD
ncbi:NAD-dependent epimerase/dehydratase family protein [Halobacterium salinarum]|uniref:NAD-dependent epimerase/dehydratase family protein n=1 Tax=Halobacterium salinarum TaxID=2242 RepID=UPI002555C7BB|nr:NAD-dependent epimerase/dehydratase family protein [Halobacterium salinarum]MDL0141333.1 GDP-mannose 4,6-dehydratase [Halobacterium salinarum]MDL0145043.1 GDP-mannose 4,6-dehydratase [Halobacterium salinarum]